MDKWYSVSEICKILEICRPTVIKLIKENRLQAVNIGSKIRPTWRIHDCAYQRFIAEAMTKDNQDG